jgi:hypothetical protein
MVKIHLSHVLLMTDYLRQPYEVVVTCSFLGDFLSSPPDNQGLSPEDCERI